MKNSFYSIFAIGVLLLKGCPPETAKQIETESIIVDASISVDEYRARYTQFIGQLTDCARPGARIIVDFITENPLSDAAQPINEYIPIMNGMIENELRHNAQIRKTKESIRERFPQLLS